MPAKIGLYYAQARFAVLFLCRVYTRPHATTHRVLRERKPLARLSQLHYQEVRSGQATFTVCSAAFSGIFLASSFFCSQAESTPAPTPVPITALVKRSPKTDFYTCQVESLEPREFFSLAARFFYIISSSIGNASPPSPARSFVTRFQAQYSFVFRRALPRSALFHFTVRCPTPPCVSALPLWAPAAAEHRCARSA